MVLSEASVGTIVAGLLTVLGVSESGSVVGSLIDAISWPKLVRLQAAPERPRAIRKSRRVNIVNLSSLWVVAW